MGSLLHGPKGSRSRLYDGVTSLVFLLFKLVSLVLNQVPTCVRKPKSNTFDESKVFILVIFGRFRCFRSFQMVLIRSRSFLDRFRSF